jgi:glycosyltransferase involved in cell wall biosynthesis
MRYVLRLARHLRRLQPDVVHTNTLKAALYGGVAARLARVPTVTWHLRDRIEADYMPSAAVRMVRTASRLVPDGIVANSASTLATLRTPRVPCTVLASPLDPRVMPRQATERRPVRIGVLGRLAPWKGQDLFLRAFAHAAAGHDAVAVIIGAALFGEDAYADSLRVLAADLDIEDRVEWRGFREDVGEELGRLDILVHCSVLPEPFGQVVVEGMAAGLAVVAADRGGPAEIIDDGRTGLLYPMGDALALGALLGGLLDDAATRERLGAAGVRAAEAYRPELLADDLAAFWDSIGRCRG